MKRICGAVLILILTAMVPATAYAEWFVEPYMGAAFTSNEDVDITVTSPGTTLNVTVNDIEFEDSLLLGIRAGYWFPSAPNFGIWLDLFHYSPEIKSQTKTVSATGAAVVGNTVIIGTGTGPATVGSLDIDVIGLTPELLLRLKVLESQDFPDGQIQPYISLRPTFLFIDAEDEEDTLVGL